MTDTAHPASPHSRQTPWEYSTGPSPEHWGDWVEFDAKAWPERREKHYRCIPTICFNCESACGLLAFVDKQSGQVEKFEGNPVHPGSRGRTCAKGPATINQVKDNERILAPLKRVGKRGSGEFVEVSWEEALRDIGERMRNAIDEKRQNELMYHVGRPGEDHFVLRMLQAWGIDGHNSHTNVCSANARLGYMMWMGADRPSPDYSDTKFILLLSAHLETGHYFNPHAQRIISAKEGGARIGVIDTRLSNTSTHADHWVSPWPGTEAAMLLGIANLLLQRDAIDWEFVRRWMNWEETLEAKDPNGPGTFEHFQDVLRATYDRYTPDYVAEECKIPKGTVEALADEIERAGRNFASHLWRNTAAGNMGGWQVARCLVFLHVLTGSVGTPGGLNPNSWDKAHPHPTDMPPARHGWNEAIWPKEWPLAHYEMSFLLPHLLEEQDAKVDVYFTRVYNPVWTNPDGAAWIAMFEDEKRIGCHVALTPIWSETAQWADYVLPMGVASERHDLMSQETHAGNWIGYRQPVLREYQRLEGNPVELTHEANPGKVWEETEFWIHLSWKIDPDGSRGIREWFESKQNPGTPITVDEYFGDIFDNDVPGLPEKASELGLTPLEYMKKFGAFEMPYKGQERYEADAAPDSGVELHTGERKAGFPTPTKKLEFFSKTLDEWGFADQALPGYIRSQVHWDHIDQDKGERCLLPTFRLPTLIHTRSGNAKWLQEISHTNPLWVHPEDARKLGLENGKLARVSTRIGYFVVRAWVTEGIHPGVVACSHHVGRWRLHSTVGGQRAASSLVEIERGKDTFKLRQKPAPKTAKTNDPDSARVWWNETGVNQNMTFPVQPDPASGMHCWHQKVTVTPAQPDDRYGDIFVDLAKSREVYAEWKKLAKPPKGNLRRPLWLKRPLRPREDAYYLDSE